MNRKAVLPAALLIAAFIAHAPALAQKVYINYAPDYDSSKIETFSWKFTPETSLAEVSPFLHSRIVVGVEYYLTMAGFRQVDEDADIQVTYHASAKEELRFDTSYYGYGYPTGWYASPYRGVYGGGSYQTTTVSKYVKGTLVVDVWDTASQKLVWRGTAKLSVVENPDAVDKKVDKAIAKMVKKWQKIKKQAGR